MIYIVNLEANQEQVGEGTEIALILKQLNIASIVTGISSNAQKAKTVLEEANIATHFIEK